VIGVILRLQAMTLRGRVVRSLRLLRQPKYLIGSLAAATWMLLWVGPPMLRSAVAFQTAGFEMVTDQTRPAAHLATAFVTTFALVLPWLWPWGRPGLRLREAELTLLLQAPLTRRQVIEYGLLKSAPGTIVTALILALMLDGGLRGQILLLAGLLPLFAFWTLHASWRAMLSVRERESPAVRRCLWSIAGAAAVFLLALAGAALPFVRSIVASTPQDFESLVHDLGARAWPPVLQALLLPGWLLTAAPFARGPVGTALAGLPVVVLAGLQLELVLRSRARFEERALEWARRTEARQSGTRRRAPSGSRLRRRWEVFGLASAGRPEVAVLWKNLMRVSRLPLLRGAGVTAALCLGLGVLLGLLPTHALVYTLLTVAGLVIAAAAPMFAGAWNNDLRTDLAHLELVRTWPLPAERLVAAEVASPALLSFLLGLAGLGLALAGCLGAELAAARGTIADVPLASAGRAMGVGGLRFALLVLAGAVPLLAGASFAASALQNLATLFIPAWMLKTPDANKGIAAFGRNLIVGPAIFFGFVLVLLPGAVLLGLALLAQRVAGIAWSAWEIPLWGLLAAAPLAATGGILVFLASRLWAHLDPSAELLEIGR
jgi:ABC-2 type transport system permease protein